MSIDGPGLTIVELPTFMQQADKVWAVDELEEFKGFIAKTPLAGDVIPRTGGLRKIRWSSRLQGKGKRSGSRVIYYFFDVDVPIYLLDLYLKGERIDLGQKTMTILKRMAGELKAEHKGNRDHVKKTPPRKGHGRGA